AGDAAEGGERVGFGAHHFGERGVVEDDVGRHAACVRGFAPPGFERFEQFGVGAVEAGFDGAFGVAGGAAVFFAAARGFGGFADADAALLAEDGAHGFVVADGERGALIVTFA